MKGHRSIPFQLGAGLLLAGTCGQALAQPTPGQPSIAQPPAHPSHAITKVTPLWRHLEMNAAYVRETKDQAWTIRISGDFPAPPGLYFIVYNEKGDVALKSPVPAGSYSPEAPFVLTVPADGLAQQYVIKWVGATGPVGCNYFRGPLPMTDLPFEVYGGFSGYSAVLWTQGGRFYILHPPPSGKQLRRVSFQVKPGVESITFTGSANLRILDDRGAVVAEGKSYKAPPPPAAGSKATPAAGLTVKTRPGQIYWVDPGKDPGFETAEGSEKVYVTFDPERWFSPSLTWELDTRPWEKGLFKYEIK